MFPSRYFATRYFNARYWMKTGATLTITTLGMIARTFFKRPKAATNFTDPRAKTGFKSDE